MLGRPHRLTKGQQFAAAIRGGRRAGSATLALHLAVDDGTGQPGPPRVGLVVGKAVGNAVERNRVKRRLRHLARPRVEALPVGSLLVIRALPASVAATSERLAADLDSTLARLLRVDARS